MKNIQKYLFKNNEHVFMNTYYYFCWLDITDEDIDVDSIKEVETVERITEYNMFSNFNVKIKKNGKIINVKGYELYSSEKQALKTAVDSLKNVIEAKRTIGIDSFRSSKNKEQLELFLNEYADKYPEIFI